MWPVDHPLDSTGDNEMICMLCSKVMKAKCSTAARHQDRKHANSKTFTRGKQLRIIKLFESNRKKQQAAIKCAVEPQYFTKLAPFKLALSLTNTKCLSVAAKPSLNMLQMLILTLVCFPEFVQVGKL